MGVLDGKAAVVTGAGGGAGEAPIYLAEAEGHGFRVITRL